MIVVKRRSRRRKKRNRKQTKKKRRKKNGKEGQEIFLKTSCTNLKFLEFDMKMHVHTGRVVVYHSFSYKLK